MFAKHALYFVLCFDAAYLTISKAFPCSLGITFAKLQAFQVSKNGILNINVSVFVGLCADPSTSALESTTSDGRL